MTIVHSFIGQPANYAWTDVPVWTYQEGFEGVTRQVIIGPAEGAPNFAMRYFRLEPGTHSQLDQHLHEHGVLILHGHARLQINEDYYELKPLDAVFISGNDVHQFEVSGDEPLGFLCVVPKK